MKTHKQINIKIDTEPLEKYIKKKWKKFLLSCVIFRSNVYYVHFDFGYYCVGKFDGFVGDKAKLKVGDKNHIIAPIDEFFKSKQSNMVFLYKKLNGI